MALDYHTVDAVADAVEEYLDTHYEGSNVEEDTALVAFIRNLKS